MKETDFYLEDEVRRLKKKAFDVERKINNLLLEGTNKSYKKVLEIIFDKETEVCFQVSRPLNVLRVLSEVVKVELEKGCERSIFCGRDLYALEELYQEMVFRLRRVEFGKPINIKEDILQFIVENGLSLEYLIAVVQGTHYLYDKDRIWKVISSCKIL